MAFLGPLISAGASLLGGLFGQSRADARAEQEMAIARENIAQQREFAQKGIRWRAADALKAGIHPLYAMGAQTASFAPVSVGGFGGSPLAEGIMDAGQDIGRAVGASMTPQAKSAKIVEALSLERAGLENELLRSQIRQINAAGSPRGLPGIGVDSADPLQVGAREIVSDPNFGTVSMPAGPSADTLQGQIGEVGDWIAGYRYINEWLRQNTGRPLHTEYDKHMASSVPWYHWLTPRAFQDMMKRR